LGVANGNGHERSAEDDQPPEWKKNSGMHDEQTYRTSLW